MDGALFQHKHRNTQPREHDSHRRASHTRADNHHFSIVGHETLLWGLASEPPLASLPPPWLVTDS